MSAYITGRELGDWPLQRHDEHVLCTLTMHKQVQHNRNIPPFNSAVGHQVCCWNMTIVSDHV